MITYTHKNIFKISLPLILGMLIQVMVGVTDTAFLGRVGEIELGASAIAGVIYLVVFMISQSFAAGAQIIIARRNGEQNYRKTAQVLYQCFSFIILFSGFSILAVYLLAPQVLDYIIADDLVRDAILIYLCARSWGLFFSGGKAAFRAFFIAITHTRILLSAALILLLTNIVFDYWLIFGGLGIPPLGLKGAAIASVIAESCAFTYLLIYTLKKVDLIKYGFDKFLFWSQSLFNEIFHLSVWIAVQNILSWSVWLYFFIEIEKLGTGALAISNILRSLSALPFIFANALAMVTSSIVSNLVGAAKNHEIMPTAKRIIETGALPYYGTLILMALLPRAFLSIYTDNTILIQQAVAPFYAMLFTYIIALPGMIYFYAIYGICATKQALIIEIICAIAYIAAIRISVGIMRLDLMWCWMTEFSYYVILWPASYLYLKKRNQMWHKL